MATLSAQSVAVSGTAPTYSAADSAGDEAPVGNRLVAHVRNASTASVTVTVTTPGTVQGLDIADATLSVPASGEGFVPLDSVYRDPSTNRAALSYDATTDVSIAVLKMP